MRPQYLLLLIVVASPSLAQSVKQNGAPKARTSSASAVADIRAQWKTMSGYVLQSANDVCERAYAQSDAAVAPNVGVFGEQHSRLYALMMNATHGSEHYGNLVTYLRMNGMVPPSSR